MHDTKRAKYEPEVIYGKLTVHDRQTKFMLRSLERGLLTLAPIIIILMTRLRPEWPNSQNYTCNAQSSCSDCCGTEFESTCNLLGQSPHLLFQVVTSLGRKLKYLILAVQSRRI